MRALEAAAAAVGAAALQNMHDGAMYIAIGRIRAVRCVLPATQRNDLPADTGMRHRAALGLAEKTDALVIVVSEETGLISLAMEVELDQVLYQYIKNLLIKQKNLNLDI